MRRSSRLLAPLATATLALSGLAFAPTVGSGLVQRHVVVLDEGVTDVAAAAEALLAPLGAQAHGLYQHAINGFAVDLTAAQAAALTVSPLVDIVEADRTFRVNAELPAGVDRTDADRIAGSLIGTGQRVDVDVAVIDTGSDRTHRDLDVVKVIDCYSNGGLFGGSSCQDVTGTSSTGGDDDHGHGTHVAGTIGALDNGLDVVGVAPGARIWSVKVLGGLLGSGSTSDIIAGIDYVAGTGKVEVINMSLGGSGTSAATNAAIAGAANKGVVTVVAAGNDTDNAANYTPANAPAAITVSAITDLDGRPGGLAGGSCSGGDDEFATYSNYGTVVEIAAPGSCITSTRLGGGVTSMSGTSMASPHVAGAAALYIARNGVPANGQRSTTVLNGLLGQWSTPQAGACGFDNPRSAEPLLLLVPCGEDPGPDPDPTNTAPDAVFTTSVDGLDLTVDGTASSDADGDTLTYGWTFGDGATATGATAAHTYAAAGTYTVTLTVSDGTDSDVATTSVTVAANGDPDPATPTLTSGQTVQVTLDGSGDEAFYKIAVPAGASNVTVTMTGPSCGLLGCSFDADLYTRDGQRPTDQSYDCRPFQSGSNESCSDGSPTAGFLYIRVDSYSGSGTVSLKATVS